MIATIKAKIAELTGNKFKIISSLGVGVVTEKFALLSKLIALF